jgi:hypothetical protein
MEENQLSFNMTIWAVQNQMKINTGEILDTYKITPKHKAQGPNACSIVQDGSHAHCQAYS